MKRIVQILATALVLAVAAAPARSLSINTSFAAALSSAVEASKARSNSVALARGADFAISKIDKEMVEAFGQAWRRSGNGTLPMEGVVLILRIADGRYIGQELGATNENKQFTFRWRPGTIAIVHTHPNTSDPKPQDEDIAVADKHHVPIFTITSRGMYVYDPSVRKLSRVMSDLSWLEVSKWSKGPFAKR